VEKMIEDAFTFEEKRYLKRRGTGQTKKRYNTTQDQK